MTKQDKDLLLRDLCARLPYGVKIPFRNNSEILLGIKCDYCYTESNTPISTDGVKPFLRPMSSMTEEEIDKLFDILKIDKAGNDDDWIKINDALGIKFFFPTGKWIEDVALAYDYLNSIHIDYLGLIEKGLAIAVTPENNPYK